MDTDYTIRNGKIKKVEGTETNEGPDRLIGGRARYKRKTGELRNRNFIEVKKGTFDNLKTSDDNQSFSTESGEEALNIFKFITANSRIEHEKNDIVTGSGDKVSHFYTSYDDGTVEGGSQYLLDLKRDDRKMNLIDITHNHPDESVLEGRENTPNPSPKDKKKAALFTQIHFRSQKTLPTFHIWHKGEFHEYKQLGRD